MPNEPRFDYYEEVRIASTDDDNAHLNGQLGVILGRTPTDDERSWYYTVDLYHHELSWCFFESELEPTGKKYCREDFYDGTSIRVQVDEKGRGSILPPDPNRRDS